MRHNHNGDDDYPRNPQVAFRCSEEMLTQLDKVANEHDMSRSEFLRRAAEHALELNLPERQEPPRLHE
jgi:metal-responsive CopG/Arc/MetJ family transcriptional regulator